MVPRDVRDELLRELVELEHDRRRAPSARRRHHGLELALDSVLVAQPIRRHLELQRPDRAQDQIVAEQRPEELRRALLAQLREPLL